MQIKHETAVRIASVVRSQPAPATKENHALFLAAGIAEVAEVAGASEEEAQYVIDVLCGLKEHDPA